jgi:gluconolactonase
MQRHARHLLLVLAMLALAGCNDLALKLTPYQGVGMINRFDPAFDALVDPATRLEKLDEGFDWAEGPVWIRRGDAQGLLFSDIPKNSVMLWMENQQATVLLNPSGYTGDKKRGGEPGSNGLAVDRAGNLILCQHGDRRIAMIERSPNFDALRNPTFKTLASKFEGKRFNSPNDLCIKSNGDIYFTDPPYGLEGNVKDPAKELDFQGVYRLGKDGTVTLLTKELSRPNGIAFSPDERTLYVANSDPDRAIWMAYPVTGDGTLGAGKLFFDATDKVKSGAKGLPDGLKVDEQGNLWATGPGGVLVFSPQGKHLATIDTTQATANVGWGNDGTVLYITADALLCRLRTKVKGAGWAK